MRDQPTPSFSALGINVHPLTHEETIAELSDFLKRGGDGPALTLSASGMNNLGVAQRDPYYFQVMRSLDLVVPDGFPLFKAAQIYGYRLPGRTYGPDLMKLCLLDSEHDFRHFILGGTEEALRTCITRMESAGARTIVGSFSPPFGDSSSETKEAIRSQIIASGANLVWVCLGSPKQEIWCFENKEALPGRALLAVGAAVDFLGGNKPQAPKWMQTHGLEWLFRLLTEPRRLWRRYLLEMPPVAVKLLLEIYSTKKERKKLPN